MRRKLSAVLSTAALVISGMMFLASPAAAHDNLGPHWAKNGNAHAQLNFIDHTGSLYPVNTVTYQWNQAQNVDSWYQTSCPGGNCIDVWEVNVPFSNAAVYGWSNVDWDSEGHIYRAVVNLNSAYVNTAAQARKTTCHEMGHAFGIGEVPNTPSTCMMQGSVDQGISQYPNGNDYAYLGWLYSHW